MSARRDPRGTGPGGRAALAVLALTALAVLGGCGDEPAGGPGAGPAGSASAVPATGSLTVVLDEGNGTERTWALSCAPGGTAAGDHPDPAGACAAIAATPDPWAPVAGGTACTMVYGGPQVATVRGTWDGAGVDARFDRADGCATARWDRLVPLLPETGPGTASSSS